MKSFLNPYSRLFFNFTTREDNRIIDALTCFALKIETPKHLVRRLAYGGCFIDSKGDYSHFLSLTFSAFTFFTLIFDLVR